MVSCINVSMSGQKNGPGPIRCDEGWKFVIHFRSRNKYLQEANVSCAEKFLLFSRLLLLDIEQSPMPRKSNRSALEPLSRVNQALLDHAALCRRVPGETSHTIAAKRLRMMAQEYESRAHGLEGTVERRRMTSARPETFKSEQTHMS